MKHAGGHKVMVAILILINYAPRHEDVWRSGDVTPIATLKVIKKELE
jgi:hypothetical protein